MKESHLRLLRNDFKEIAVFVLRQKLQFVYYILMLCDNIIHILHFIIYAKYVTI